MKPEAWLAPVRIVSNRIKTGLKDGGVSPGAFTHSHLFVKVQGVGVELGSHRIPRGVGGLCLSQPHCLRCGERDHP